MNNRMADNMYIDVDYVHWNKCMLYMYVLIKHENVTVSGVTFCSLRYISIITPYHPSKAVNYWHKIQVIHTLDISIHSIL